MTDQNKGFTEAGFALHSPGVWTRGDTVIRDFGAMTMRFHVFSAGVGEGRNVTCCNVSTVEDAVACAAALDAIDTAIEAALVAMAAAVVEATDCKTGGSLSNDFKDRQLDAMRGQGGQLFSRIVSAAIENGMFKADPAIEMARRLDAQDCGARVDEAMG